MCNRPADKWVASLIAVKNVPDLIARALNILNRSRDIKREKMTVSDERLIHFCYHILELESNQYTLLTQQLSVDEETLIKLHFV